LTHKPSNSLSDFSVLTVGWQERESELRKIRHQVFIVEQNVPPELEWDGLDEDAIHLLALNLAGNKTIGSARLLAGGKLGRMAVLEGWRGKGAGKALLQAAIAFCRQHGWPNISLSAQSHAIGFYQQAGFVVCSEEYLDAGIAHRDMRLRLSA
jgi:predicted GNAT family N-acyltransferase